MMIRRASGESGGESYMHFGAAAEGSSGPGEAERRKKERKWKMRKEEGRGPHHLSDG